MLLGACSSAKPYACNRPALWSCDPSVPQVAAASAFAQTLRRYTSLNHLAQAARAVLQNTAQINQMLSDLNRVDFANVQVTEPPGQLRYGPLFVVCPSTVQAGTPWAGSRAATHLTAQLRGSRMK